MRFLMAIMIAVLILIPAGSGTTITDVRWNANQKVIEILFDKFPAQWGDWTMYVDGEEWPMEGGSGNAIIRPNAPVESANGLFIGTDPWVTSLEEVNFPCCGKIQFQISGERFTNEYEYNLAKDECKTASRKDCGSVNALDRSTGSGSWQEIQTQYSESDTENQKIPAGSGAWREVQTQYSGSDAGNQQVPPGGGTWGQSGPDETFEFSWKGTMEQNVDLPDSNLRQGYALTSSDPQICANDCANDPECRAFTYVKPGFRGPNSPPECWLKRSVPRPLQSDCCISGVKSQEETALSVDWNNIPGLVLHLFHNVNQGDPQLDVEPSKTNLRFYHGGDSCASEGQGYSWWMIEDIQKPKSNADWKRSEADASDLNRKLPSGLVLGLINSENQNSITVFARNAETSPPVTLGISDAGALEVENGGDRCPNSGSLFGSVDTGYYWYETHNNNFQNWDEAENNLPKGTILGLKHSMNQPYKTISWRGLNFDPVKSFRNGITSPPTFTVRHGGDLGAPEGEGFYWYEKTTGPDFFQPRS